jgi:3-isopropylmalate dehydrogenase
MEFDVAVLPGDGVGPEVIAEAMKVLQTVGEKFGHSFRLHDGLIGGVAIV